MSKRSSHGHHLTPQDADAERTYRRRHRKSSDDGIQRYRSSERGYRSENESRRRHKHDKETDRASSSHRHKKDKHRRRDSSSDSGDDADRSTPRTYGDHHAFVKGGRERGRSDNKRYGEHRFFEEDVVRQDIEPQPVRHTEKAMYGDHTSHYLEQVEVSSRRPPSRSRELEYGEHRHEERVSERLYEDPRGTRLPPVLHYSKSSPTVPPFSPPPEPLPASMVEDEDNVTRTYSREDSTKQAILSPTDGSHMHRSSLPSRARDLAFPPGTGNTQAGLDSRPSTSGPVETHNTNTEIPRLSVSQYPTSYSQSLPNMVTPGDSRSETGDDWQRPRSGSGASTTSTRVPSRSPSLSGSGILGPKVYQYQPLRDSEIRLVRVLPERMWKLKCEILHVSLDDAPEYTAISYAWGDGVDTRPLVLEGAKIDVAVSLHDALRAVRRKKEDILVWIDALCIDQQNKDERATQVRLMGQIYSGAVSVAIWIGPEYEESALALQLLQKVAQNAVDPQYIKSTRSPDSLALFNLFKRDYWKRLWVVQEVLLANHKMVYCGYSMFPWEVYQRAAEVFWDRENSDPHIRQGPSSFPERNTLKQLGDESLLEVMRACRKKLSENPRDKVFGILGLLSDDTQRDFPVDYSQSVKAVYTDVVDHLISTTDRLDVIREAIHFPLHVNSTGLPSWCPDWSHIPEVSGLGRALNFAASNTANGPTKAQYWFHDERRKLEISAIRIDTVMATGVAVGTFCAAQDYLTAFLQWRAVLLHELKIEEGNESHPMHKAFCRTLCLGQVPPEWNQPQTWHDLCYHVFAALIRERMPRLPIDEDLRRYADITGLIGPQMRRKFLQDHFGNRMMGRSLCITEGGLIGMGSGYMTAKDIVVVPVGCSTPILLRLEGRNEYRYVGDVYIDGYMHGEAVAQMEAKDAKRIVSKYMLC